MHRAHVLGAAMVCYIMEQSAGQPSQNNASYGVPPPWPGTHPELPFTNWDYRLERLVAQLKLPTL